FMIKLMDGKIYVSCSFIDYRTNEVIGEIHYNKWKLYNKNLLDFYNDDKRLEVRDNYGNIAFAIKFTGANSFLIYGYFVTGDWVSVATNSGIKNCLERTGTELQKEIKKIETIFPEKQ